jgi:hypothetical protein
MCQHIDDRWKPAFKHEIKIRGTRLVSFGRGSDLQESRALDPGRLAAVEVR